MTGEMARLSRRGLLAAGIGALIGGRAEAGACLPETGNGEWEAIAPLEPGRSEFAAVWHDGAIYIAGGFGATRQFERYDPALDRWTRLPDLPAGRHHAAVVADNRGIIVVGGHDGSSHHATDTLWRYDLDREVWRDFSRLPQGPRGAAGVCMLDGRIFVAGGSSGDLAGPATDDVWSLELGSGEWRRCAPLPLPREHLAMAAAAGGIVAVGGRDGADESLTMAAMTTFYQPECDCWSEGAPLPEPRAGLSAVSTGTSVIVLGGERTPRVFASVQEYDPQTGCWRDLPSLPEARHGIAAACGDGMLYAIGGSKLAGRVDNSSRVDRLLLPVNATPRPD